MKHRVSMLALLFLLSKNDLLLLRKNWIFSQCSIWRASYALSFYHGLVRKWSVAQCVKKLWRNWPWFGVRKSWKFLSNFYTRSQIFFCIFLNFFVFFHLGALDSPVNMPLIRPGKFQRFLRKSQYLQKISRETVFIFLLSQPFIFARQR